MRMSDSTLDEIKEEIAELVQWVKTERDELNLQIHLAKSEAHDEWSQLEKKWAQFQHKAATVSSVASEATQEIGEATRVLGEELKSAYRGIRKAIANSR
jgi:hypothetical protein